MVTWIVDASASRGVDCWVWAVVALVAAWSAVVMVLNLFGSVYRVATRWPVPAKNWRHD